MMALGQANITPRLIAAAAVIAAAAPALAQRQVQNVSPYFAVVVQSDALLRCGPEEMMYAVARLTRNQMLRVDGEGGEGNAWARVGYPSTVPVFVFDDTIQMDPGGKFGTTTKPAKLKAVNMTTGLKGSWRDLLDQPLAIGTRLTILDAEPVANGRGNNLYKAAAPEAARAYIPLSALRKATTEEINAYMTSQGVKPEAAAPSQTRQADRTSASGEQSSPANVTQGPATLADPVTLPTGASRPVEPPQMTPETVGPSEALPVRPIDVEVKPVQPLPPSPYERLEAAFEAVRRQPSETAEFTELMHEYQAAINNLADTPANQTLRARLQQRLDYLSLSADIQEKRRRLAESQQSLLAENDRLVRERLEEISRTRQYTIVGRLSASTIYDGKRLPLMYRVQTVGGPAPRTLAYLKPDPSLRIEPKLGQLVGVQGEAVVDPTLRINIITPTRVDALEAAGPAPTAGVIEPIAGGGDN